MHPPARSPGADGQAAPASPPMAAELRAGARASVISADMAVRQALVLLLEADGIGARGFPSAAAFQEDFAAEGAPHCVLVEEGRLPDQDSQRLATILAAGHRAVTLIVLTGIILTGRAAPPAAGHRLVDPFQPQELLRTVRQALAAPPSAG